MIFFRPEHSEKYLEEKIIHSLGAKLSDPKKYITPSPGAYRPEHSEKYLEEKIYHSLGIKHSPYLYDGNKNGSSAFRSRSGTYTKV